MRSLALLNFYKKQSGPTVLPSFFLVFFMVFFGLTVNASSILSPPDSTKKKYDINDPRNPDCPCHKYQKLADDEYRALQQKTAGRAEILTSVKAVNKSGVGHRKNYRYINLNRKGKTKRFRKKREVWAEKFFKRLHSRKDPSSCFHWS